MPDKATSEDADSVPVKPFEASAWRQIPVCRAQRSEGSVDLDYRNKVILAPMVRVGTLPMRLLALKYGADIVYSPETIDRRLARSKRVENPVVGTVDFIDDIDGSVNLRIHPNEKSKLVVQIGSSDPETAVKAALNVANDAAGIDLNCGCPKRFSIVSAMGAALMSEPDRLCAILTALVENVPLPITAKIRMFEKTEDTIALVQRIERTGVSAIGLHCRLRSERPTNPGHWSVFEPIAQAISVPLIANGDIFDLEDIQRLQESAPSVSSFMMARGPQVNFSAFSRKGLISSEDAVREYTRVAIKCDMPFHNAKYVLMQMQSGQQNNMVARSRSYTELCQKFELTEFYERAVENRLKRAMELGRLDLLRDDVVGVLGPDCPYLPDTPFIPAKRRGPVKERELKNTEVLEDLGAMNLF